MAPLRHQCAKLVFSENYQEREPSMGEVTTIGLDLAEHVFRVHGIDAEGATVLRRQLRRGQVLASFSRLPCCVVGLAASPSAANRYLRRRLINGASANLLRSKATKADPASAAAAAGRGGCAGEQDGAHRLGGDAAPERIPAQGYGGLIAMAPVLELARE